MNTELPETYRYKIRNLSSINFPTVDAFTQHMKRVYFQVQVQKGAVRSVQMVSIQQTGDGYLLKNVNLSFPKKSYLPGPPSIMNLIFCGCKTDWGT